MSVDLAPWAELQAWERVLLVALLTAALTAVVLLLSVAVRLRKRP